MDDKFERGHEEGGETKLQFRFFLMTNIYI